ncbi:MAG: prepilin peptidase [Armatimonadota bacterium]
MQFWFWALVVFIYGAVIGSFLNVCIYRMPIEQSIIYPPSHCPKCNKKLRWIDNIPLLSFLMLRCKCRYCGEPISWRYFTVELITGLISVALFAEYGFAVNFFLYALFTAALIAVFFIDLEHWVIPDQLSVWFGMSIGVVRDIYGLVMHEEGHTLLHIPVPFTGIEIPMLWSVAGLFICGGIFLAIAELGTRAFKKEAMGGGDVKLAGAIGAVFCGAVTSGLGLGLALLSFFIAVFAGSIIGIGWMIAHKGQENSNTLPFGPMMVSGVLITMFFGNQLINWYMQFLHHGF